VGWVSPAWAGPNFNPFANTKGITDAALSEDPLKQYYDLEGTLGCAVLLG
jgi:hypothetical protein